jgi:hypothetical protein
LECDSGGVRRFLSSAFDVHIRLEDEEALESRAIEIVKVQWTWYGLEDATWEHEDDMQKEYPHIFEDF